MAAPTIYQRKISNSKSDETSVVGSGHYYDIPHLIRPFPIESVALVDFE